MPQGLGLVWPAGKQELLGYRPHRRWSAASLRDLKQRSPGVPVILISGLPLWEPEKLTHVDAFVSRGETLDSLLSKIRELIGRN
jgi:hypothetical protein